MSPPTRLTRRSFWAPEIVQTSAMDCGPAALKCVLAGFGVPVSYGRLREACQTSVDGTSIDTLEEVAQLLGLEASQIMLPPEHAVARAADTLPAIAVVRMPSGLTHFVVLWRRFGPYLQVMDPARGRRWVRADVFLRDLYLHTQAIDAEAFRAFAADPAFTTVLGARFTALAGAAAARQSRAAIDAAAAAASWRPLARLDGAARAIELLVDSGTLRRGADAGRALRALLSDPVDAANDLCASHACVGPAPPDERGAEQVSLRGAVLVHIAGRAAESPPRRSLPAELAAALAGDDAGGRPLGRAFQALGGARIRRRALPLIPLLLLAAGAGLAEVLLSRPLLSAGGAGGRPLAVAAVALLATVATAALLEWPLVARARALGRALDVGLRRAFFRKLPRLGDRYFASRPVSDMAERAHLLHRVRLLPGVAVQLGRTLIELGLATAAIAWLYPRGAVIAVAMFVVACAVPFATVPAATERDLRLRTHAGSLLRFYLDVLLGLPAVRTHGAGPALLREHEARLVEWRRAGRDLVRTADRIEAVTVLVAVAGAAALVNGYLRTASSGAVNGHASATVFLLLFLALRIPTQATAIVGLWRQVPEHRNVTLRLLEPLGAPEDEAARAPPSASARADGTNAAAISFEDVAVEVAGHVVLKDLSLSLRPGAHVAIVGPSGAGKSTLIGLLLGFHQPAHGRVLVDGVAPRGEALATLRAETVWVDPVIQLWNRTLTDNIAFGADSPPTAEALDAALADAELTELAARLPSQALGEGGGLVSGGEGQRIRFARALARPDAPRLVLLDEPFRGLDREVRRRLLERARARWRDATLLVVTHDLEHTLDFPRVLVVDGGRVVEDDDAGVLAARPASLYRRLLDAEARVKSERWSAPFWRRVTVRDGRVEEGR
ncbi:MAG TPA: ATP-binding cassette domain-containing protein [Polyangia bacterium]|jgi:ATP-binding cassette subfamily B protein